MHIKIWQVIQLQYQKRETMNKSNGSISFSTKSLGKVSKLNHSLIHSIQNRITYLCLKQHDNRIYNLSKNNKPAILGLVVLCHILKSMNLTIWSHFSLLLRTSKQKLQDPEKWNTEAHEFFRETKKKAYKRYISHRLKRTTSAFGTRKIQ